MPYVRKERGRGKEGGGPTSALLQPYFSEGGPYLGPTSVKGDPTSALLQPVRTIFKKNFPKNVLSKTVFQKHGFSEHFLSKQKNVFQKYVPNTFSQTKIIFVNIFVHNFFQKRHFLKKRGKSESKFWPGGPEF